MKHFQIELVKIKKMILGLGALVEEQVQATLRAIISFDKDLDWPTYQRVGLTSAAYKVLVGEDGHLLGAHVLSDNAAGLINTFTLAMVNSISIETLFRQSIMTPYPSRESDIIYMLKPMIE